MPEEKLDPVLRCDSCQSLVRLETLHKRGVCTKCGNKRVRSVTMLNEKEKQKISAWGFDDFLENFEAVPGGDEWRG